MTEFGWIMDELGILCSREEKRREEKRREEKRRVRRELRDEEASFEYIEGVAIGR